MDGTQTLVKIRKRDKLDFSKCFRCTALCCRYMAMEIDEPETRKDFDQIRWYVSHELISVFIEDGTWYLNVATPCEHLLPDNKCAIYDRRPQICREHDPDGCEFEEEEDGSRVEFHDLAELEAWLGENTRYKF